MLNLRVVGLSVGLGVGEGQGARLPFGRCCCDGKVAALACCLGLWACSFGLVAFGGKEVFSASSAYAVWGTAAVPQDVGLLAYYK